MKEFWRIVRRTIIVVVCLFLLFEGFRYRAKSGVEKYRKQLISQGEKLTIFEIEPHPSAPEQTAAHDLIAMMTRLGSVNFPIPLVHPIAPGHILVVWREDPCPT